MSLSRVVHIAVKCVNRVVEKTLAQPYKRSLLGKCGKKVKIGKHTRIEGWENVEIGNHVSIGVDCVFLTTRAKVIIGNHVIFGPDVSIITGNHRIDVTGKYIDQITDKDKLDENDEDVVIEGDNWIGAHAIILKGVRVGRGAIVAAGAVVTKSIEPYEIVGGVPAHKIGVRFDESKMKEHESILYSSSELIENEE